MKRTIAHRTRRAYFLVLLVPCVLGIFVLWFAEYYRSSNTWLAHTHDVLTGVDDLLLSVTEAETFQRGYALTGSQVYVNQFVDARIRTSHKLAELRQLTTDNSRQQRRLDELSPLIAKRVAGLQELIELRRTTGSPFGSATAPIRAEGGLLMDTIRNLTSGLTREERRLLAIRKKSQDLAEWQLGISFVAGLIINVALLYRAYEVLIRYSIERDEAEAQIRDLNEDLERRVQERTAELVNVNEELTRSNEDLSRFAHVASHDLQEPLRTVASYAGLLERRYLSNLDGDAALFLRMIISGAKRMQNQVQDLLRFSRTNAKALRMEFFNLQAVIEEVKEDLAASIAEQQATITYDFLPRIYADRNKLRQLIENLISNALKFRKPDANPHIAINATQDAKSWMVSVADNGIGFEPEFSEKIFIIFQRLHSVGTYPGTGIGLAICKRIVEAHGGRIWAASTPGVGSTFSFTLPALATGSAETEAAEAKAER